jgi:hypothetical protein
MFLKTGITATSVVSMIVQYTGASVDGGRICGARGYFMSPYDDDGHLYVHGNASDGGLHSAAGNIALANLQGYFDGLSDNAPITPGGTEYAEQIYMGAQHNGSGGIQQPMLVTVRMAAFYEIDIAPYITALYTAMSGVTAESDNLADGLVEYWTLDEASGDATGEKAGVVLVDTNSVGADTGIVYATARTFDGSSSPIQSLQAAYNAAVDFTGSFTFAAWVYQHAAPSPPFEYHRILSTDAGNAGYRLSTNIAGSYWCIVRNGVEWELLHGPSVPSLDAWHCVFFWHDADNDLVGLSVDNSVAITEAYAAGCASSPNGIAIGGVVGDYHFDGRIGPVACWNRVLNATERNTFYNGGAGKTYASL